MIDSTILPTHNSVYSASFALNAISTLSSIVSMILVFKQSNGRSMIEWTQYILLFILAGLAVANLFCTGYKTVNMGTNIFNYAAIVICTAQFLLLVMSDKIELDGFGSYKTWTFIMSLVLSASMMGNLISINTYSYTEDSQVNRIVITSLTATLALLGIIVSIAKRDMLPTKSKMTAMIFHIACLISISGAAWSDGLSYLTGKDDIQSITYTNVSDEYNPGIKINLTYNYYQNNLISIAEVESDAITGTYIQTKIYDMLNGTTTITGSDTPIASSSTRNIPRVSSTRQGTKKLNYVKLLPHITKLISSTSNNITKTNTTTLTDVLGQNNQYLLHNLTYVVDTSDNKVMTVRDVITLNNSAKTYVSTQTYNMLDETMKSINSSNVTSIIYNPVIRPYIVANANSNWILTNEISQTTQTNIGFVVDSNNTALTHQLNYIIENNEVVAVEDKIYTNDNSRTYLCTSMYDISNNVQTITDVSGDVKYNSFIVLPNYIINNNKWSLSLNTLNTMRMISANDDNKPNISHQIQLIINSLNQVMSIQDIATLNGLMIETETYDVLSNVTTHVMPSGVISANNGVNIPQFISDAITAAGLDVLKSSSNASKPSVSQTTVNNIVDTFNASITHNITYSYNDKNVITEIIDRIYSNNQLLETITYDLTVNVMNIDNGINHNSYSGVVLYDYLLKKADGRLSIPKNINKPFITQVSINSVNDDNGNEHNLTLICNGNNVLMISDNTNGITNIYDINGRFATMNGVSTVGLQVPSFIMDAVSKYNTTNRTRLLIASDVQANNTTKSYSCVDTFNSLISHDITYTFNSRNQLIWIENKVKIDNKLVQTERYNVLARSKIVTPANGTAYTVSDVMYPGYMTNDEVKLNEHVNEGYIIGEASRVLFIERNNLNVLFSNGVYHNVTYIVDNNNIIGIIDKIHHASNNNIVSTEVYNLTNGIKTREAGINNSTFTNFIIPSYISDNINNDWRMIGEIKRSDNYTYEINNSSIHKVNANDENSPLTTHEIGYVYDNQVNKNIIYISDVTYVSNGNARTVVQEEFYDLMNGIKYTSNTNNANTLPHIGSFTPMASMLVNIDESRLASYLINSRPSESNINSRIMNTRQIIKNVNDNSNPGIKHNITYTIDSDTNTLLCVKDEIYEGINSIIKTTITDMESRITTSQLIDDDIKVSQQLVMNPTVIDNTPNFVKIPEFVKNIDNLIFGNRREHVISITGLRYEIDYMKDKDGNMLYLKCRTYNGDRYNKGDKRVYQIETYDFINGFKTIVHDTNSMISSDLRIPLIIKNALIGQVEINQVLNVNESFNKFNVIDNLNPSVKHNLIYHLTSNGEIGYVSDTTLNIDGEYLTSRMYDFISDVAISGEDMESNPSIPSYIFSSGTHEDYESTTFLSGNDNESSNTEIKENVSDIFGSTELNRYIKHKVTYYKDGNKLLVIKDEHMMGNIVLRTDYYDFRNNMTSTEFAHRRSEHDNKIEFINNSYILQNSPIAIDIKYVKTDISERYSQSITQDHNTMVSSNSDYYYEYNRDLMLIKSVEIGLDSNKTLIRTVYYDAYRDIMIINDGSNTSIDSLLIPKSISDMSNMNMNRISGLIVAESVRGDASTVEHNEYSEIKHIINYITKDEELVAIEDITVATGITNVNGTFSTVSVSGLGECKFINKKIYDIERKMTFEINGDNDIRISELRIPEYISSTGNAWNNGLTFSMGETASVVHSKLDVYNRETTNNIRYIYGSDNKARMIINDIKMSSDILERKVYDIANDISIIEVYQNGVLSKRELMRGVDIPLHELEQVHINQYSVNSEYINSGYTSINSEMIDRINEDTKHNITYVYDNISKDIVLIVDMMSNMLGEEISNTYYTIDHKIVYNGLDEIGSVFSASRIPYYISNDIRVKGLRTSLLSENEITTTMSERYTRLIDASENNLGDFIEIYIREVRDNAGRLVLQEIEKNLMESGVSSIQSEEEIRFISKVTYDYINDITINISVNSATTTSGTGEYDREAGYSISKITPIVSLEAIGATRVITIYMNGNTLLRAIEDAYSDESHSVLVSSKYYDLTSDSKYIEVTLDSEDNLMSYRLIEGSGLPTDIRNKINIV